MSLCLSVWVWVSPGLGGEGESRGNLVSSKPRTDPFTRVAKPAGQGLVGGSVVDLTHSCEVCVEEKRGPWREVGGVRGEESASQPQLFQLLPAHGDSWDPAILT